MSHFYLSLKFACTGPSAILHIYIIEVGEVCVCVCVCVCWGVGGGGGGGIEIHFRESREAKLFDYDR